MKTHLTYKRGGKETGAALCGNNKYGLRGAFAKEFRNTPREERCSHCERLYLEQRNKVRKTKGLPPVAEPFEGLDHAD